MILTKMSMATIVCHLENNAKICNSDDINTTESEFHQAKIN